jgi:sortase A
VAGHRDTFFRALRNVRSGDVIQFRTPRREAVYVVESTTVVDPGDTFVMAPTRSAELTLITCYPFRYIGAAPERFVVRAVMAR